MIKVTICSNNPRKTVMAAETKTIREVLDENDVRLTNASVSIDGFTLGSPAELDKQLCEHTSNDTMMIGVFVNKDNAAQAVIVGSACIVKSTLTPEDILKIKKYSPELLTMEYDNGEPAFAIDIDERMPGSLNEYGACFGGVKSEDGKATITVVIDPEAEDATKLVEERFGHALLMLDEMETAIAEKLPELRDVERRIRSMITRL